MTITHPHTYTHANTTSAISTCKLNAILEEPESIDCTSKPLDQIFCPTYPTLDCPNPRLLLYLITPPFPPRNLYPNFTNTHTKTFPYRHRHRILNLSNSTNCNSSSSFFPPSSDSQTSPPNSHLLPRLCNCLRKFHFRACWKAVFALRELT